MLKRSKIKDVRHEKALEFLVSRAIVVELEMGTSGRCFNKNSVKEILSRHSRYTNLYGCYVYSIKAGRGFTPIYVGSTTKRTLGEEAFDSDKLLKCLQHITSYKKGSLQVSFIIPKDKFDRNVKTRRGRCPKKIIEKLEKVLTAVAYRKNKNLINIQNRCMAEFFIRGALNSEEGRPKKEVAVFKQMIGLRDKLSVVI